MDKIETTWIEYMRKFKPDITEQEAEYILWNETCYPFSDKIALTQIENYFKNQEATSK